MVPRAARARQSELALEKKWVTQDGWFRIFTTIVGMCGEYMEWISLLLAHYSGAYSTSAIEYHIAQVISVL